MRTIYAVESGSYSDHTIHAMFEDAADAATWVERMTPFRSLGANLYEIVERELFVAGEIGDARPRRIYFASWSSKKDSPTCSAYSHEVLWPHESQPYCVEHDGVITAFAYGESQAQALKACQDYGYQLAAELKGLT